MEFLILDIISHHWQIGTDMTDIDKLWDASPLKYALMWKLRY